MSSPPPDLPPPDDDGPPTRRLGAGMMVAAWVLVLGLLAVPLSGLLERQNNPNANPVGRSGPQGRSEVTLERNRFGHYVANGAINRRRVTFLLDTGATLISVPESLAGALGLRRGRPVSLRTANGTRTGYATRLDEVRLGNIVMRDVAAVINPGHGTEEVLLGMSFLKELDFNQSGNRLTLRGRSEG